MGWFFCYKKYIYKVSNNEVTKNNIIKMHLIVKVHFQKKDKVVYEKQYQLLHKDYIIPHYV